MKNTLFLILGKGQSELTKIKERDYNTAEYFFPDNQSKSLKTAFVGEAIVKLNQSIEFDKIHIFGTADSMWDILYLHFANDDYAESEKILSDIYTAKIKRNLVTNNSLMSEIEKVLSQSFEVDTSCHIIKIGQNNDELWEIFEAITSIKLENTFLHIDITHGLRFQPFFLYLAAYFNQQVQKKVELKSIFYGALELSNLYSQKAPIFDLKPFLDLMNWINASNNFKKYGDSSEIVKLLIQNGFKPENKFLKSLGDFSISLNTNQYNDMLCSGKNLLKNLDSVIENAPEPLKLLKDTIIEIPKYLIMKESSWKKMLFLAEKHYDNFNYGLSAIALNEAIISRFADILNVAIDNIDNYKYVSESIFSYPKFFINELSEFYKNFERIRNIRNIIAHIDSQNRIRFENNIGRELKDCLFYFKNNLHNKKIESFRLFIGA